MSAVPSNIATLVVFNVITIIGFIGVAVFMVRRARNPKTVPRDALEQAMLPKLRTVTPKDRLLFGGLLIVAVAAPWIARALEK